MKERNGVVWITWERQLRNRSMADKLNVKLYEIVISGNRVKRYLVGVSRTVSIILRNRPQIVFAQNPSIVLTVLLIFVRPLFRYKYIIDSHFGGVEAYRGNKLIQKVLDFCNRVTDLVIVTNAGHEAYVRFIGGKPFVCQDPLPDISRFYCAEEANGKSVLFICSFDIDEPYVNVLEAARGLVDDGFAISVSGNYSKVNIRPEDYPQVNFLGFLPEDLFYRKLFESHVIVDLTTYENCLVCGAYEAMAAEKPLVTSDTLALRQYFDKGAVFSREEPKSISEAIRYAFANRTTLKNEVSKWRERARMENDRKILELRSLIESWC